MGLGILTLKKAAGYALFRTLMGISGKDPAEIYKPITLHKIRRAEGLSFLRKGGVTVCLLLSFYAREALLLGQDGVPPSFPEHYILSSGQAPVHYVPGSVVDHPQRCSV